VKIAIYGWALVSWGAKCHTQLRRIQIAEGQPGTFPGDYRTEIRCLNGREAVWRFTRNQNMEQLMDERKPIVAVLMGSASDAAAMKGCIETLMAMNIPCEVKILSAHRTPELTGQYAESSAGRGIEVIISGAGWAAHLAGAIAARTLLPVIGVPLDSSPLSGMDALLSTVQMPPGIPVATVAVGSGGAKNAAVLAAQILALKYSEIASALKEYREKIRRQAEEKVDGWENV